MAKGPQYGHHPRCGCAECKLKYGQHNTPHPCTCAECAMYREQWAPLAVFTPPLDVREPTILSGFTTSYVDKPTVIKVRDNSQYGKKRQSMATINMCERPGCDAIIKGNAVGTVYVRVNAALEGERVEETKDYCPACIADIVSMLDSEPLTERKKAYDKPYVRRTEMDDAVENASDEQLAAVLFQRLMKQAQRQLPSTVDGSED